MAKGKKTGGRQKGTPNRDNPLKATLRNLSETYFTPRPQTDSTGSPRILEFRDKEGTILYTVPLSDPQGNPLVMSDCEVDMLQLAPNDRMAAHLRILKFHTPEMKAVEVDMDATMTVRTIEDRLRELCGDADPDDDDDD